MVGCATQQRRHTARGRTRRLIPRSILCQQQPGVLSICAVHKGAQDLTVFTADLSLLFAFKIFSSIRPHRRSCASKLTSVASIHGWVVASSADIRASASTVSSLITKSFGRGTCFGAGAVSPAASFHTLRYVGRMPRFPVIHGMLWQMQRPIAPNISGTVFPYPMQRSTQLTLACSEMLAQASGLNSKSPATIRKAILAMLSFLENGCFPDRIEKAIKPRLHMSTDCAYGGRFQGAMFHVEISSMGLTGVRLGQRLRRRS